MKNTNSRTAFYFSAYPLKALNLSEVEKKSYLHIYTESDKSIKRPANVKVLPMTNPYPAHKTEPVKEVRYKSADEIEERENAWFANYE